MSFAELAIAIGNTIAVICCTCLLAVPTGVTLALLLQRTNVWGRTVGWIAVGSQLAVPLYVVAGGWSAGFGLQGWLREFGITGIPWGAANVHSAIGAILAVSIIHAFAAIPWVCFTIALGLLWSNRNQEEQGYLDAGTFGVLRRILLPKLKLWVLTACLICILPIMTEMVVSNLYQASTVAELVYLDASLGMIQPRTYAVATLICMLPILFALLFVMRGAKWRELHYQVGQSTGFVMPLGNLRPILSLAVWGIIALIIGLPIVSLIAKAGWKPYVDETGTGYGWDLNRFTTTCTESVTLHLEEFSWSFALAALATLTSLTLAITAYAATNSVGKWLVSGLMLCMICTPGPLVGTSIAWLLNRSEPAFLGLLYDQSLTAPVMAQQFRLLPIAWLFLFGITRTVPPGIWEQVALDGLNRRQMLFQVLLPNAGRLILAASLMLFVLSLGELSCSILVLPPGVTTVAKRLFEMLHFGMRHQDSGLCGILLLLGWIVSITIWFSVRGKSGPSVAT